MPMHNLQVPGGGEGGEQSLLWEMCTNTFFPSTLFTDEGSEDSFKV